MTDNPLQAYASKLRRLIELREERDASKQAAEKAESEYRDYEAELWDDLSDSPIEGALKVNLGEPYGTVTFQPKETFYGRIIDEDAALERFEQRALVDELTEPKIAKARLHEHVREWLEQGEGNIPEGVDWYAKRFISITRPKS